MKDEHLNLSKLSVPECQRFSSTLIKTYHSMLNLGLSIEQLLAELEDVFPPVNPTPDTSINNIMYRSGQRSVVEWIQSKLDEEK
jgi:hypothetical protein